MKSDEEIIKIFKEKMKFEIGCTFAGIIFVGIFILMFVVFMIFANCAPDGMIIVFIIMMLFCCIDLIYKLCVKFYNLNAFKEGNYSICIKPTVGNVGSGSRGGLYIRVKDCDESFDFTSDNIENFSHKVYYVTTPEGTYPVCFCKE